MAPGRRKSKGELEERGRDTDDRISAGSIASHPVSVLMPFSSATVDEEERPGPATQTSEVPAASVSANVRVIERVEENGVGSGGSGSGVPTDHDTSQRTRRRKKKVVKP